MGKQSVFPGRDMQMPKQQGVKQKTFLISHRASMIVAKECGHGQGGGKTSVVPEIQ
jgi:hypothetical protein